VSHHDAPLAPAGRLRLVRSVLVGKGLHHRCRPTITPVAQPAGGSGSDSERLQRERNIGAFRYASA